MITNLRVDLRLKLYCVPGGGGGGGGADGGAGRGGPHGGEEAVQQVGGGGVLTPGQQGLLHTPDDRVTFPAMQVVSSVWYTRTKKASSFIKLLFFFSSTKFSKIEVPMKQ